MGGNGGGGGVVQSVMVVFQDSLKGGLGFISAIFLLEGKAAVPKK